MDQIKLYIYKNLYDKLDLLDIERLLREIEKLYHYCDTKGEKR